MTMRDRAGLEAVSGAALDYGVTLAMPANASAEHKRMLHALGAELILTDTNDGIDGTIRTIRALVAESPERYFYPDQFNNPANGVAHYQTTGPEIWQQTEGGVTHFVAALGTSGTFMGTNRFLREQRPAVILAAVQPDGPYHAIEGVKHMQTTAFVPGIYDPSLSDRVITITSEHALATIQALAHREGLLVGISAAANVAAAIELARELREGVVVTVLCDSAARYLSEPFWDDLSPSEG